MGDLNDQCDLLESYWKNLHQQWEETRLHWKDSVGDYFEHEFWQDLEKDIPKLIIKLQELDEAIAQALRNVEQD